MAEIATSTIAPIFVELIVVSLLRIVLPAPDGIVTSLRPGARSGCYTDAYASATKRFHAIRRRRRSHGDTTVKRTSGALLAIAYYRERFTETRSKDSTLIR
jgi:hypothetical protein